MTPGDTIISIRHLRKTFGELKAVDDLSFDVRKGEIFGFLGPNGAGKTTTIHMICGLLPPTDGRIIFYGDDSIHQSDIRTRIGVCPQENIYWSHLTCMEQMLFIGRMYGLSGKKARTKAGELLDMLGLKDKSGILAQNLSGGMKRRLNIGLALIHNPEILVLDEPEAGLDPQSRILVRDFIRSLVKEKTIILTTHNMDEADRLSDRVAIIDFGKLLLTDTPGNMKKSIGEGDMLEILLERSDNSSMDSIVKKLGKQYGHVYRIKSSLGVRSKNMIEKIPQITSILHEGGIEIKKITLRENTLEDVFIHLTGRKLRE
jgi:ABC-2 type transport system ATP-binding protein